MKLPTARMTARIEFIDKDRGPVGETLVYEGEILDMTQQQQDQLKGILGDGKASTTVSREVSEKDYGNGVSVFVSITLTCDQSMPVVTHAADVANWLVGQHAEKYLAEGRQQAVRLGLLRQQ